MQDIENIDENYDQPIEDLYLRAVTTLSKLVVGNVWSVTC